MICGLFSSFDPSVILSTGLRSFYIYKWLVFFFLVTIMNWRIFTKFSGMDLLLKKLVDLITLILKQSGGTKNSFSILFTLFIILLSMNLFGLIPWTFSLTSHLSVNLGLSITLWLSGIFFSLSSSINSFLSHLVPIGSPTFLWPLLVMVESVSLVIRPLTLAIRLMANNMAGHLILSLIGSSLSKISKIFSFSFILEGSFLMFEICVSVVQAYVFFSLMSLYWSEK